MGLNCRWYKPHTVCSKKQGADITTSSIEPNEDCPKESGCNFSNSSCHVKANKYIKNEEKLAQKLKNMCDTFGKECDYLKSALVFHELGLLYQNRNPDMLSLIKCAALFNAAIARSPSHSRERIENDLKQLCF